jgi:hypothetical protein
MTGEQQTGMDLDKNNGLIWGTLYRIIVLIKSVDSLNLHHVNVQRKKCLFQVTCAYKLIEKILSTVFKRSK